MAAISTNITFGHTLKSLELAQLRMSVQPNSFQYYTHQRLNINCYLDGFRMTDMVRSAPCTNSCLPMEVNNAPTSMFHSYPIFRKGGWIKCMCTCKKKSGFVIHKLATTDYSEVLACFSIRAIFSEGIKCPSNLLNLGSTINCITHLSEVTVTH